MRLVRSGRIAVPNSLSEQYSGDCWPQHELNKSSDRRSLGTARRGSLDAVIVEKSVPITIEFMMERAWRATADSTCVYR